MVENQLTSLLFPTCVVLASSSQRVGTCTHEAVELVVKRIVVGISRYHAVLRG